VELHFALYCSRACVPDTPEHHWQILQASQTNNLCHGLTGFLHREQSHFIQFIEGPKTPLNDTLARIGRDPRHNGFEILQYGPLKAKLLPDWQMGFVDPGQVSLVDLLGITEDRLEIKSLNPFDLVMFLAHNASCLRKRTLAA
jgi:hypothetical protein